MVGEPNQYLTNGGLEEQAIVVMDSPGMGFYGQSASKITPSTNLGEVPLTHEEVREGIPSEQSTSQPTKATSSRSWRSRLLLPDWMLLYSYIPPQGQAPPMEEVLAPGLEDAQEIINRWKPFNRGESSASHLKQLYPAMLRMPIEVRVEGKGEKYVVSIPAYACKEYLKQVVEEDMLIRNHNFVQSVDLVRSQLLCTVLVSLLSYYFIRRRSFVGRYDYPEHDLPASRVPNSAEGCGEVAALAQSVVSDHGALSASLADAESSSRCWDNEAKESIEKMARVEAERDTARHDASMVCMDADTTGNARAKVES